MEIVNVELKSRSYPIFIGTGLLQDAASLLKPWIKGKAMIVTDQNVELLYGQTLPASFTENGMTIHMQPMPPGETTKTMDHAMELYTAALKAGMDRRSCIIALGGGVIGDLAGFVAATYMRGIDFIQIPTSLLAQVDSSVGGKVAVDHPMAKNIIGAFHQPKAVIADISVLKTLPKRELSAGLAEVIKYGAGLDEVFFYWLEQHISDIMSLDEAALAYAVKRSCQIKAGIVQSDETENGKRALLNFGHTFGHAIEVEAGYGAYLHGEAVSIGMVYAARLANIMGLTDKSYTERLIKLLKAASLPVEPPGITMRQLLPAMYHDKKVADGKLTFILPTGIGQTGIFSDIPENLLLKL
ncbi:3-dehydroquinate synthase [Mahella australiensis]|uniref:3-dehydroquinate synthase n=1 Tax=Mahella australiensis (strain DSM 15567 / CIP 107919 / 50-1 BON) TaxID=697281 RepID=F4A088_MAHA5|nr:3-dehydroquinate synthase [Mahella australiensis]AEE96922.1 3-dehydroquinate synthase [Mahella australiensis 50-1 BON]